MNDSVDTGRRCRIDAVDSIGLNHAPTLRMVQRPLRAAKCHMSVRGTNRHSPPRPIADALTENAHEHAQRVGDDGRENDDDDESTRARHPRVRIVTRRRRYRRRRRRRCRRCPIVFGGFRRFNDDDNDDDDDDDDEG